MNKLFESAVLRLTGLYVIVLSLVCILFSGFIYHLSSTEITESSRNQVVGFRNMLGRFIVDEEQSEKLRRKETSEALSRLRAKLFLANIVVIASGTLISYWFARKTLDPIEETVRMQERFTSDASHELRTPLAVMRSEIEVALRDKSLTKGEAVKLLSSNLEEVVTLHGMVENLLYLARHKEIRDFRDYTVSKLVHEAVKKYTKTASGKNIQIIENYELSRVKTNRHAVIQICGILIDNAIKYSPEDSQITIRTQKLKEGTLIEIEDSGIGIGREFIDVMFDRFSREDRSRNSHVSGQGLGLSIAKQLCDAIGGKISVTSTPGKGSVFQVLIPSVQS